MAQRKRSKEVKALRSALSSAYERPRVAVVIGGTEGLPSWAALASHFRQVYRMGEFRDDAAYRWSEPVTHVSEVPTDGAAIWFVPAYLAETLLPWLRPRRTGDVIVVDRRAHLGFESRTALSIIGGDAEVEKMEIVGTWIVMHRKQANAVHSR
jgi:hypothetical protein